MTQPQLNVCFLEILLTLLIIWGILWGILKISPGIRISQPSPVSKADEGDMNKYDEDSQFPYLIISNYNI